MACYHHLHQKVLVLEAVLEHLEVPEVRLAVAYPPLEQVPDVIDEEVLHSRK